MRGRKDEKNVINQLRRRPDFSPEATEFLSLHNFLIEKFVNSRRITTFNSDFDFDGTASAHP